MASKDMLNNLKAVLGLDAQTLTADGTGAEVDMQGYNGLYIVFNIGESADTLSGSVKIECEIQHSDASGSGFAAAADADVRDTVTGTNTGTVAVIDAAAEDSVIVECQYVGNKRYVKPIINLTGTHSNGTPCAITTFLFDPQIKPAA